MGLQVAPVGFGCHRLEDTPEQINALQGAIRLGCNLIDVAPGYTGGAAERAVGCALRQLIAAGQLARDEVVVVTKVLHGRLGGPWHSQGWRLMARES
mmetsp:Transcript_8189/g.20926  ORF Transcript_8189/g.20926 Transcript_8189/m.20926 type:complete len:97 (+) Transcript_8189:312-602(+)